MEIALTRKMMDKNMVCVTGNDLLHGRHGCSVMWKTMGRDSFLVCVTLFMHKRYNALLPTFSRHMFLR